VLVQEIFMYKEFYSIQKDAFSFQLDPELFFNSRQHKEAWYFLAYNFKTREPFILMFGNHGTGKTTLCLKLIHALEKKENIPYVYIQTPNYNYAHILKKICHVLNLEVSDEKDEQAMQDIIYEYAEKNISSGVQTRVINIIIDDAQDVQMETLWKLRMLANFFVEGIFPFRFIFFSHTSFVNTLKKPQMLALHQRIRRRFHLEPFDVNDTRDYIYFRLNKAGAPSRSLFTDEAILAIYYYTSGIPRLINIICDTSLMLGAANRAPEINRAIVDEAFKRCQGVMQKQDNDDQDKPGSSGSPDYQAGSRPTEKPFVKGKTSPPGAPQLQAKDRQISVDPHIEQDQEIKVKDKPFNLSFNSIGIYVLIFVVGLLLAMVFDLGSIFK
jgi:general secretion pathway protein A